jgi:hypothetical protein
MDALLGNIMHNNDGHRGSPDSFISFGDSFDGSRVILWITWR